MRFDNLNSAQLEAIKHIDGPLLILAGAGSGKTKTITSRLAYLISIGIDPYNTLTLTFTNKAALHMRHRAYELISTPRVPPILCTFHKFGLMFLKMHIEVMNRSPNFLLIDRVDKKRIISDMQANVPTPLVDYCISLYKNENISIQEAHSKVKSSKDKQIAICYKMYEEYLMANNLVDFDDLILLPFLILNGNEDILKQTSQRYQYIMVDEFQDTNKLQYDLLLKLAFGHNNLCVVGDDDQSIYSWRGARIENILNFQDKLEDTKVIKLEQNYRSTPQILQIANNLIAHNENRLGKTLIATKKDGLNAQSSSYFDEKQESTEIAKSIKNLLDKDIAPQKIAVLFRLNALSRSLEEALNRANIPYKLIGTIRFYERAEIKDILSYFRLALNINDDFSLKRVINKPKRGIGKITIDKLETNAKEQNKSIYKFFSDSHIEDLSQIISKKNISAIKTFFDTLKKLQDANKQSPLKFLEVFEKTISIKNIYNKDKFDFENRESNIYELYGFFREYFGEAPDLSLEDFINDLALQSDQDTLKDDCVSCMSVHASKGLEFDYVFIMGFEDGFFPMLKEDVDIEEERRLAYVAFTRAKERLFISYVSSRFYKGYRSALPPSSFLDEAGLIQEDDFTSNNSPLSSTTRSLSKNMPYKKSDIISHKVFGYGIVQKVTQDAKEQKLTINFGGNIKDILASFVTKVDN